MGYICIEDLRPNDLVYSHDGKPHRVIRTLVKRHCGAMYGIRCAQSESVLWLTGDHRVLVRRRRYAMNGQRTWENVPGQTFANARALRKNLTASERRFWSAVRGEQLGVKFRRQHPIGAYIADFFCPERALVVEIDGDSHYLPDAREYDATRTETFRALGIEIARYSNSDVTSNISSVLEDVCARVGEKAEDFWDDAVWLRAEYLREGDVVYYGQDREPIEITSIEREETDEEVFDIEVEGAHSFITETCAVHNCGSGTTAYVAEQWGRRWITTDTSRIALNIAKTRLMTAVYPYYTLHDEAGGDVRQGFVYKTVPHITLKSLANDEPPATETLYDQPKTDAKRLRVSGPFTVETLQTFEPVSPEELAEEVRPSEIEGGFEEIVKQHLLSAGIKNGRKNEMVVFRSVETLSNEHLHAEGFYTGEGGGEKKAYFHIGPKFGAVSKRQVNEAIKECRARGDANWLVILGFSFESSIKGSQQTTSMGGFEVTKCRIHDDLLQDGLKKKPAKSAASFVTIGEPDIALKRSADGAVRVEVLGLDIYDPIKDEVKARNLSDIAYWTVDDDYDGSNFVVRQVFFCGGGGDEFDKWKKGLASLAKDSAKKKTEKTLKIELDDEAFDRLYRHVSHPITLTKKGQKIAVRIVSQFGEECTKVLSAE